MYSHLKILLYFFNFYFVVLNNFIIFSTIINKNNDKSPNISKCCDCCNCCKDDKIIKKEEEIINEKTVKDLDLDKNISETFIKNNKERVFKMIKVFNKCFKYEDIDEILLLLYNLNENNCNVIMKYLYSKFVKNEDKVLYLIDSNRIFYIFLIDKKDFSNNLFFGKQYSYYEFESFNNNKGTYKREFDITKNKKNIAIKVLFDYFYKYNIENNRPFPLKFIGIIADYLYFFKKEELKKELERINYFQITLEDKLYLEKPVYFYLNEKFKECYEVENEEQFIFVTNNIEQIILKISSDKIEFYGYKI